MESSRIWRCCPIYIARRKGDDSASAACSVAISIKSMLNTFIMAFYLFHVLLFHVICCARLAAADFINPSSTFSSSTTDVSLQKTTNFLWLILLMLVCHSLEAFFMDFFLFLAALFSAKGQSSHYGTASEATLMEKTRCSANALESLQDWIQKFSRRRYLLQRCFWTSLERYEAPVMAFLCLHQRISFHSTAPNFFFPFHNFFFSLIVDQANQ